MREQLVSFKTARIAKEKGFWIASYKCYDKAGFLNDTCNDEAVSFKYDYRTLPDKDKYLAPTQSLLQKWLREVHNIHIYVTSKTKTDNSVCFIPSGRTMPDTIKNNLIVDVIIYSVNKTYEEALEKGLFEALALIN
jgi:hypothetical protein